MFYMAGSTVVVDLKLLVDNSNSTIMIGIKEDEFESATTDLLSKIKVVKR